MRGELPSAIQQILRCPAGEFAWDKNEDFGSPWRPSWGPNGDHNQHKYMAPKTSLALTLGRSLEPPGVPKAAQGTPKIAQGTPDLIFDRFWDGFGKIFS